MKPAFGQDISLMRFLWGFKRPQMFDNSVCAYASYKPVLFVTNPQKFCLISFLSFCLMLYIFSGSYITKIVQSIIIAASIYVVYMIKRPTFIIVKPYKAVCSIPHAFDPYYYITLSVYGARASANYYSLISFNFPYQISRFWNIIKNSYKIFMRNHIWLLMGLSYANESSQARMKAP